ncbi:MAG TPA: fumarylacetoacetate hydrolase family protein, partial [Gaiellaceae bacterium]|nr:fumarylacetoacetate hydrolase family protein [Gaiellaceae bacterium]
WTLLGEWRAPALQPPKDRDFALVLGPLVVTTDELPPSLSLTVRVDGEDRVEADAGATDWERLRALAASGTELRTGDLLAGPAPGAVGGLRAGARVDAAVEPIGVLGATVG